MNKIKEIFVIFEVKSYFFENIMITKKKKEQLINIFV